MKNGLLYLSINAMNIIAWYIWCNTNISVVFNSWLLLLLKITRAINDHVNDNRRKTSSHSMHQLLLWMGHWINVAFYLLFNRFSVFKLLLVILSVPMFIHLFYSWHSSFLFGCKFAISASIMSNQCVDKNETWTIFFECFFFTLSFLLAIVCNVFNCVSAIGGHQFVSSENYMAGKWNWIQLPSYRQSINLFTQ